MLGIIKEGDIVTTSGLVLLDAGNKKFRRLLFLRLAGGEQIAINLDNLGKEQLASLPQDLRNKEVALEGISLGTQNDILEERSMLLIKATEITVPKAAQATAAL